jgi:glycosyltransferase involved in cell wall biosynthesis
LGGAEEYLYQLIAGLDKTKYEIRFVCTNEVVLRPLLQKLRAIGGPTLGLDAGARSLLTVWRFFRQHPADIVHFNLAHPFACRYAIIAAKLAGVPVVTTNHLPTMKPAGYTWKGTLVLALANRLVDTTIVESEINRKLALANYHFDPDKVVSIYYGIDLSPFDSRRDRAALTEFGVDPDCSVVGTIGRLSWQKAQHDFLHAAAKVKEVVPKTKFILVGEGERRRELEELTATLGLQSDVVFTGYRADVPAFLRAFDVFVLSSIFEGLPLTILEAMAMSKPIVSTDVDGIPEAIVNGETGLLVPPRDPDALAGAIISVLQNPAMAQTIGPAARRRVEAMFRRDLMVAKTDALYTELLAGKR